MTVDDMDSSNWTELAREAIRVSSVVLMDAIREHAELLIMASANMSETDLESSGRRVDAAACVFSDAQFDLTGAYFSLVEVSGPENEGDEADEDPREGVDAPPVLVSVIQRVDYEIVNSDALMAAGDEAHRLNRGRAEGKPPIDGDSGVEHVGMAMYELAHANGWDSLRLSPGLRARGAITQVIEPLTEINFDRPQGWIDDERPNSAFSVDGRLLYGEDNP